MASKPFQSSRLELYESSLPKPNPLRIRKRPKARPNSSPARGLPTDGGRLMGVPDSPPEPPDRPLTVRKLRKKRTSLLETADEGHAGSVILAMVQQKASPSRETTEDVEKTPRAKQKQPRIDNVGDYLKDELFKTNTECELSASRSHDPFGKRGHDFLTTVNTPAGQGLKVSESSFSLNSETGTGGSTTPKRQLSRSRRFLRKAIGGFDGARSKNSREPLIRMVSRKNHKAASSSCSIGFHSITSKSSIDLDFINRATDQINSTSKVAHSPPDLAAADEMSNIIDSEFLFPRVSVLQGGHNMADGDENAVWIAIEVTGVSLKIPKESQCYAEQKHDTPTPLRQSNFGIPWDRTHPMSQMLPNQTGSGREQDYLYEMRVNLKTSNGCIIESVIGDTREPRTMKNKQSELLIAKIRFTDNFTKTASSGHARQSSETLIAELESRLVQSATDFIEVTLTYKHSALGFLDCALPDASASIARQSTKLVTECRAIIKRHDSLAAWSPRTSENDGPLSELIRNHFPFERAESIIQRVISHAQPKDVNIPQRDDSWNSSERTVTPGKEPWRTEIALPLSFAARKAKLAKIEPLHPQASSSNPPPEYLTPTASSRELDPARKIWSEMRKNSKGTRPAFSIKTLTDGFSADDGYMNLERQRISEQAIRNKRSLGADTLRSIVRDRDGERVGGEDESQGGRVAGWVNWGPPWW